METPNLYITLNAFSRMVSTKADEVCKPYGLTASYAFVLLGIMENPGCDQKTIGGLYHFAPSTMTRFIDKLEKKDLLVREQDGKSVKLNLTAKGKKLTKDLNNAIRLFGKSLEKDLGEKYTDTLNRLLQFGIEEMK
jgi:DNA-binding MarR family transcriptional regulator